jgi:class 3 adenylate cyclase
MAAACSNCGTENPPGARYCASCGTSLAARCPNCGAEVSAEARFCPSCGHALAREAPAEERKLATALFVDLVDSTKLGDQLDPERVRSILQAYFSIVSTSVQAWGGTVEKYIGDAAVAVFGVPRVREDDAARAVSAAAEIVDRVRDLAAEVEKTHGVELAIRLGVDTGEVITPTETRPDLPAVTGDALNVASRLQSAAPRGGVLVGDRTYQATRELFTFGDAVELQLKGKAAPVKAHPLIGRIEGALERGPARNLRARVVGRERELAVLGGLLDEAIETRTPRLAIVYGPAGIGKSRLVREAIDHAQSERPDLTVVRGRCPAVGQGITYWPLAEIVRGACGISLDDSGPEVQDKLRDRAAEILAVAGVDQADIDATVFALATTAGIDLPDNPLDRSRPVAVVTELARRWPQFLSALAKRRPAIVVIEDLHWASDQVAEMVERLLARSTGAILLVATSRPEFAETHPTFTAGVNEAVTVSLRPLNRRQGASLLSGLLPEHELPRAIEDEILDTAEGNPLFVEEIVSRLIEAGTLARDDGHWRSTGGLQRLAIPDTIQGLLGARIDGLPDAERRVLREASVIGRVFWEQPVAVAVGQAGVSDPLTELERRGLVSMRPSSTLSGQVEYTFKHALIRDVAYGGLSLARRAQAHAAVAEWLADLSRDRPEELAELVAYHYQAALGEGSDLAWRADSPELVDVRRRAVEAFLVGGAAARKRFAIESAVALHTRVLELAVDDRERAVAYEEIGDDHDAAYDGDQALPAWDRAIELRRSMGDEVPHVARLAMKVARMGAVRWGGFSVAKDPADLDRYVDLGLATASDQTRAWLLLMRATVGLRWVAFHRDDPVTLDERVRAGEEAARYADSVDDPTMAANAWRSVGALLISHGRVATGLEVTRPILDLLDRVADPRERHLLIIEVAQTMSWIAGEAGPTTDLLLDALKLGRELRVHDLCHSTGTLINALYLAGRWAEIPAYLEEHLRAFKSDDAGTTCPFALGAFQMGAVVLAHRGEIDRAREVSGSMPESKAPVGMLEGLQAMAANALGDPAAAREIAQRVLATGARNFAEEPPVELVAILDALVAVGAWDELREYLPEARRRASELALAAPATDRAEGLAAAAAGDQPTARDLLERAIAGFEGVSDFEAARTREALAAIDPERRQGLLDDALDAYQRLGATPHAARVTSLRASDTTPVGRRG